jgi:aspartate/methionine/tyrosine aminotransferase
MPEQPLPASLRAVPDGAESRRLQRMHIPGRMGVSVREADRQLGLNGGGRGLLDTTHFDTVRFPPPAWAADAMQAAMADGENAYTPYRGHPAILAELAGTVGSFLGAKLTADNLALTPGTQAGLFTVMSALVDEGDLVLLADPEYLFAERMLAFLGARVERIGVRFDGATPTLDLDAIEALLPQRPKLLVFSHPHNPSGAVYAPGVIDQLGSLAVRGGFRVLADELYSRLVYGGPSFRHLLAVPGMADRCVTLVGPSKTESLSGCRIGVVVGPADVIGAAEQVLAVTSLRAPAYAQHLLRRWLVDDEEFVRQRIADLAGLRELTATRLREVPGLRLAVHRGTAYLFPDVSGLGATDLEVAARLQDEAGVIVSPGYQFGARGIGHFRVCYARDEAQWSAALDRIVASLAGIGKRADGRIPWWPVP